ncbi:MAG TPA: M48 family metallopeptidase [Thermoanaerobaculia bacterium]|nr:M48 family metallopeptidase [Thermoanaerobaculia bacterium]
MDFFASQERAQRTTRRLAGLFALAVAAVVLCVFLAIRLFAYKVSDESGRFWNPRLFVPVATLTLAIIFFASLYKIFSLRSGASAIANLLGARPIAPNSQDPAERRLLNVVEEMALAAGLPVPGVVVLDKEAGINAFAAGWTPGDSIVGVTAGCLSELRRDELQGVIGHELSHILNADARLNLRLMGWLHGLLVIALIGYWILRFGGGGSSGNKKGGGAAVPLLGLAFVVIGGVGVFFGRLIKSSVSRQREYLADASSVQFTRDPGGLAGALKKIGGYAKGSLLVNPNAEQASHFYFGNGFKASWLEALSTHPPLPDRIRRLDPSFDGTFPKVAPGSAAGEGDEAGGASGAVGRSAGGSALDLPEDDERLVAGVIGLGGRSIAARVGAVRPSHVTYAAQLLESLPQGLRERAQEPATAPALIYALLLDRDPDVRVRQVEALGAAGDFLFRETQAAAADLASCSEAARLPLLDLSIPALRHLSPAQWGEFRRNTHALIVADPRISLFELVLQRTLLRHLGPVFGGPRTRPAGTATLAAQSADAAVVLSAVAHACGDSPEAARASFDAAVRFLGGEAGALILKADADCAPEAVDRSLRALADLAPQAKKRLLETATACAVADRQVTMAEAELLRAIADSLDCPVPPFLPGQEV